MSDYFKTYTGKKIFPAHLEDMDVDIVDIAHALSNVNRYNGHLKFPYNVANHSLLVTKFVRQELHYSNPWTLDKYHKPYLLSALLHDASEAYLPDIASPWKEVYPETFKVFDEKLIQIIFKHFGLTYPYSKIIKQVDKDIRGSEIACLTDWEEGLHDKYGYKIVPMDSRFAEEKFLEKFYELR